MCGDLDEEEGGSGQRSDADHYARFAAHARALLAHTPPPNETPADTTRYMEKLFTDALAAQREGLRADASPTAATSA